MKEDAWQWLVDFIWGEAGPDVRQRVSTKANERYDAILEMVTRNPESPPTIAESALEYFFDNLSEI